jgi:hypothetical protein
MKKCKHEYEFLKFDESICGEKEEKKNYGISF